MKIKRIEAIACEYDKPCEPEPGECGQCAWVQFIELDLGEDPAATLARSQSVTLCTGEDSQSVLRAAAALRGEKRDAD